MLIKWLLWAAGLKMRVNRPHFRICSLFSAILVHTNLLTDAHFIKELGQLKLVNLQKQRAICRNVLWPFNSTILHYPFAFRLIPLLVCVRVLVPPAGTPLPPGTPTIPLSQLQQHSLALQGQHGQALATAPQPQQGQQAVFRFPAAVSLTGDLLCMLPPL